MLRGQDETFRMKSICFLSLKPLQYHVNSKKYICASVYVLIYASVRGYAVSRYICTKTSVKLYFINYNRNRLHTYTHAYIHSSAVSISSVNLFYFVVNRSEAQKDIHRASLMWAPIKEDDVKSEESKKNCSS